MTIINDNTLYILEYYYDARTHEHETELEIYQHFAE